MSLAHSALISSLRGIARLLVASVATVGILAQDAQTQVATPRDTVAVMHAALKYISDTLRASKVLRLDSRVAAPPEGYRGSPAERPMIAPGRISDLKGANNRISGSGSAADAAKDCVAAGAREVCRLHEDVVYIGLGEISLSRTTARIFVTLHENGATQVVTGAAGRGMVQTTRIVSAGGWIHLVRRGETWIAVRFEQVDFS